ncbi:MAG: hypothetical protein HYW50_02715 [Candidatus Diapherotrites archaeon]|nr:hypothetical protein [Candidatus Diapherotrites archaeon]
MDRNKNTFFILLSVLLVISGGLLALMFLPKEAAAQETQYPQCAATNLVSDIGGDKKRVVISGFEPNQQFFCRSGDSACAAVNSFCEKIQVNCNLPGDESWSDTGTGTLCSSAEPGGYRCQLSAVCVTTRQVRIRAMDDVTNKVIPNARVAFQELEVADAPGTRRTVVSTATGSDGWTPYQPLKIGKTHYVVIRKEGYENIVTSIGVLEAENLGPKDYRPFRLTPIPEESSTELVEILEKVNSVKNSLSTVKRTAAALVSFYNSSGNAAKADQFEEVETAAESSIVEANEIIALIRDNLTDFEGVKEELSSQIGEFRESIDQISAAMR